MPAKVIPLLGHKNNVKVLSYYRPRSFTSAEQVINHVRDKIFECPYTYKILAEMAGVSLGTVHNLASGKTKWPKPSTLFPLIDALGIELMIKDRNRRW